MKSEYLRHGVRAVTAPVAASPLFFFAVALLGSVPTIAYAILESAKILHFIAYSVCDGVAIAYILSVVAMAFRATAPRRVYKALCLVPLSGWAMLETGSVLTTGCLISSDTLALMMETDSAEASGFFAQYFTASSLIGLICIVAAVILLTLLLRIVFARLYSCRIGRGAIACVLLVLTLTGIYRSAKLLRGLFVGDLTEFLAWEAYTDGNPELTNGREYGSAPGVVKVPLLVHGYRLVNGRYDRWIDLQRQALQTPVQVADSADFNIVVVIGESFIKAHSELYGYYLPTNPRLKAESDSGRLIAFSDVVTTSNFTTPSLRNLLNLNDTSRGEQWSDGVYFPLVMKKAGYAVYLYDNQTVSTTSDVGISRMLYAPEICRDVYSVYSDSLFSFDGHFVDYISRRYAPREITGPKLVIYHLMGQHFPAADRYPAPGQFTAADITVDRPWLTPERRAQVAQYDNATLYNDSVVSLIISRFRPSATVLFYFSDHGEDCWDLAPMEARNRRMPDDPQWVERQFSVPFFVWMSDAFIERHPEHVRYLQQQSVHPFSLDHLGRLVLTLTSVTAPCANGPSLPASSQQ